MNRREAKLSSEIKNNTIELQHTEKEFFEKITLILDIFYFKNLKIQDIPAKSKFGVTGTAP